MKILLTGTSATQTSSRAAERNITFAGQMVEALGYSNTECDITWSDPSVSWTKEYLDSYDIVLVGLAPFTGLGSTRAYGAYSIIGHMFDSPKLRLFFDAKNPEQITHGLSSVLRTPDTMLKSFYANRKEYMEASIRENSARIFDAISRLYTDTWPITIYPRFPWGQQNPAEVLPQGAESKLYGLNLDALALRSVFAEPRPYPYVWSAEDCTGSWCERLEQTLAYNVVPAKPRKFSKDSEIVDMMRSSIGVIIPPGRKNKTWWTPKLLLALKARVPVVTVWEESEELGDAWSVLASQIEHMSDERRIELATKQYHSYTDAIGDIDLAVEALETTLGTKEGIQWPSLN